MTKLLCLVALPALASCVADQDGTELDPPAPPSVDTVEVRAGRATCASLGLGRHQIRFESPVNGEYLLDGQNRLTFQYYDDSGTVFFFTGSTLRLDGVLVEANDTTTVWPLDEANGWPSLGAIGGGEWLVPRAVSFCYDYEIFLNPNPYGHRGQRHVWEITTGGAPEPVQFAPGGMVVAPNSVTVTPTGTLEEDWFFEGPVFVNNPSPTATRIDRVTVMVGEIAAIVSCPPLPATVPAFSVLECEFHAIVPDAADRVVHVDVVSDDVLAVDRALDVASFDSHTTSTEELDRCIAVHDDRAPTPGGLLGTACVGEGPVTFDYVVPIPACGPAVESAVWYVGQDTGASASASWLVRGEVACDTRTGGARAMIRDHRDPR